MLELIFAIALPAIASALLFYVGSSSGGTDVIAMIVKKYAHVENIGMALFLTDLVMIIIACFVFDIKTALYLSLIHIYFTLITLKCQEHMFVYVNYILTQQCPAKNGGARRYVPWTAHKS